MNLTPKMQEALSHVQMFPGEEIQYAVQADGFFLGTNPSGKGNGQGSGIFYQDHRWAYSYFFGAHKPTYIVNRVNSYLLWFHRQSQHPYHFDPFCGRSWDRARNHLVLFSYPHVNTRKSHAKIYARSQKHDRSGTC